MIDGPWISIHRAAAEWPFTAPPQFHVHPGLMFKHVGVPRRLIYTVLISAPMGNSSELDSRASLNLDSGNCSCRLLSRLLYRKLQCLTVFFLASFDEILLYNLAACPPLFD